MTGRTARIATDCRDAQTARRVASALAPDNTAEMTTTTDGRRVVTTIAGETTGSLQSTVDDYVVNLQVAVQLATQDGDPSTDTHDTTHE